jgi:hypothetical protein
MMDGNFVDPTNISAGKQSKSPAQSGKGKKRVKLDGTLARSPGGGGLPFRIPVSVEKPDKSHLPGMISPFLLQISGCSSWVSGIASSFVTRI